MAGFGLPARSGRPRWNSTPGGMLRRPSSLNGGECMAPATSLLQWGSTRVCTQRLHGHCGGHGLAPCSLTSGPPPEPTVRCHRGKLSVLNASDLGWMLVHGMSRHRPLAASQLCWPWCSSRRMWCRPPAVAVPLPLSPPGVWAARGVAQPCRGRRASTGDDGIDRGERYCNARGEILRPLHDQLQRRRSASSYSSIKNESVGSEDDQTPS